MKSLFILFILIVIASCKKETIIHLPHFGTSVSVVGPKWIDANDTSISIYFTSDSIYTTISDSTIASKYLIFANDTIDLPYSYSIVVLSLSADSLIYNDFEKGIITRYFKY